MIAVAIVFGLIALRGQLPESTTDNQISTEAEVPAVTPRKGFAKPQEKDDLELIADKSALATCQSLDHDEAMRLKCEEALHYSAVVQSASEDGCALISTLSLRQLCYDKISLSLAVEGFDLNKCGAIEDLNLRDNCLNQVQSLIAKNANTKEACEAIASESLKSQCLSRFYTAEASLKLDQNSCKQITEQGIREECEEIVLNNIEVAQQSQKAILSKKNLSSNSDLLSLCEKLGTEREVDCKNAIYPRLAFENKDVTECNKISVPELADNCKETQGQAINEHYLRSSIAQNNKTLCDQITNGDIKNLCLSS